MPNKTDDLRIINTQELVSPRELIESMSPSSDGIETIINAREEISLILNKPNISESEKQYLNIYQ